MLAIHVQGFNDMSIPSHVHDLKPMICNTCGLKPSCMNKVCELNSAKPIHETAIESAISDCHGAHVQVRLLCFHARSIAGNDLYIYIYVELFHPRNCTSCVHMLFFQLQTTCMHAWTQLLSPEGSHERAYHVHLSQLVRAALVS